MFIDELDLPAAFKHHAELVEAGHRALKHHAIDQEQRHPFVLARGRN